MHRKPHSKWLSDFLEYYRVIKLASVCTIKAYFRDISDFIEFINNHPPNNITRHDARAFIISLQSRGLAVATIRRKVASLKSFYQHLIRAKRIEINPFYGMTGPRKEHKLPKFLDQEEVANLLKLPNPHTLAGRRDAAIMEMIYTAGLRLSELIGLRLCDMDFKGLLMKILGKGTKERILPIGRPAAHAVMAYLSVAPISQEGFIFRSLRGHHITGRSVERIIAGYMVKIGRPELSVHSLRHSCATHLLENGCDIRYIQELLGHVSITTTQAYTHVNVALLKRSYNSFEGLRESMNQVELFSGQEMVGA